MKKTKIIIFFAIIFIMLNISNVFGSGEQLYIEGDTTVELGKTKTLVVKMVSDDKKIGIISGIIENNSELISFEKPVAQNGWSLTFNATTGKFIMYNEEGANSEEIMKINYTAGNNLGSETIQIKDITFTTIEYETVEVGNITKELTIENTEDKKDENEGKDDEVIKPEEENKGTTTDKENKDENKGTLNTEKENIKNENLPHTGIETTLISIIASVFIISIFAYIKYRKTKIY